MRSAGYAVTCGRIAGRRSVGGRKHLRPYDVSRNATDGRHLENVFVGHAHPLGDGAMTAPKQPGHSDGAPRGANDLSDVHTDILSAKPTPAVNSEFSPDDGSSDAFASAINDIVWRGASAR